MVGVPQGEIELTGENFTQSSTVLFDGVSEPTFFNNSSTIGFEIPIETSLVPQSHTVQVSNPNGKSNIASYEVYAPQPGPSPFLGQATQYMSEALFDNPLVPDLNGDGRADLVTMIAASGSSAPQLAIRYGQADGTFSAPQSALSFTLKASPYAFLAGDFNGDGHTDLVLLTEGSYQVLLNDGTGHFSSVGTGALSSEPFHGAVVGDFNHDGKLDFAYATSGSAEPFSLFLGNGDGTFAAPVFAGAPGVNVSSLTAADLNNDGYTDLVYVNTLATGGSQVRILLSSPSGSFNDVAPSGLLSPVYGLVVADFNNDHIPDLFVIDPSGKGIAYFGVGDGTFRPASLSPVQASDGYLVFPPFVAGDFDNDGNIDIATRTALFGPDEIVFLWGDGHGNFTRQAVTSDQSFFLQVGDINGDGLPDIFSSPGSNAGFAYPSVVLGRRDRNFPSAQILFPQNYGDLSAANVFGDGYSDLLVSGTAPTEFGAGVPGTIFHAQADGTFPSLTLAPSYPTLLVDLDGDGIADMIGMSGTTLLIWKGDGSGQFQTPINQIPVSAAFQPLFLRDMDGDGHMDIVMGGLILYGKGNFQFDAVTIPFFENFLVGDFDGDGIPDIATPSGVMFGQGNRSFTAPTGSGPLQNQSGPFPTTVAADINRDGMDDIVLADGQYIAIYISTGRQGFVQDQALIVNGYAATVTSITVADFNGDGLPDIAAGMLASDDLVLFTNDGSGKYQVTSYAIGVNSVFSITADFNHDGKPDLAFLNYAVDYKPPTVTVLLHK